VPAEPTNDDNPIEEILLTGFPNPERIGCLPRDIIEALGQKKIPRDNPAWRHIWNCSPCFRDFKVIRDRRLAEVERKQQKQRLFRLTAVMAAGLAIAASLAYVFVGLAKKPANIEAVIVPIDLTNTGITRGSADLSNEQPLASLPRAPVELRITLPRLSKNGNYMVGILKSKSEDAAVALGSVITRQTADSRSLVLTLRLDLSAAENGRYYLATRLLEPGEDPAYYYPVLITSK